MNFRFVLMGLVLLSTIWLGCATEDTNLSAQSTDEMTSKIISYGELNLLPDVPKKKDGSHHGITSRLAYSNKYDFSVDTDQILMVKQGKYRSFSFPVLRSKPTQYMENLFLHPYNKGYLAYLLRFDFDKNDMQRLADGIKIDDIQRKMHITPLDGFDIGDLDIRDMNYENLTTDGVGDPVYWNGKCWRVNNVRANDNGEPIYDMIECPGCGCTPPSGGGGGGGGSSGSGGISMAQYYAILDLSGGYWGSSSGSGGGGGGGGSTNPSTIFNPPPRDGSLNPDNGNPIIGIIHPHIKPSPCKTLSDLADPTKGNIRPYIDSLKVKVNGTNNNNEMGIEFKKKHNYDDTYTYTNNMVVSQDEFSVAIAISPFHIGGAHNHPDRGYPMFSFGDVKVLRDAFAEASEDRKEEVVYMLVCKDQANIVHTYAIKVDNYDNLNNSVNAKMNSAKYATIIDLDARLDAIIADQAIIYSKCNGEYAKSFLNQFVSYDISLYEADDDSLINWSKFELDSDFTLPVIKTPCN